LLAWWHFHAHHRNCLLLEDSAYLWVCKHHVSPSLPIRSVWNYDVVIHKTPHYD
jgi:hypothetical protein